MPSPSTPEPSTAELDALIARAREADGAPPFSDQSLVDVRLGTRILLFAHDGAAIIGPGEVELVIDPDLRGLGNGTALLEEVLGTTTGDLLAWSHGDHPAARALAVRYGFAPVRTLLQLEAPVPEPARPSILKEPEGDSLPREVLTAAVRPPVPSKSPDAFVVGRDEEEWVALNARIFAFHPEQGSVTVADLEELEKEGWFDAADFLVAREAGAMIGYCWLKVDPPDGEIYVIGVDPSHQGSGLGRVLMNAAYSRLAARGIRTVHLYVEGDNEKALALYRSLSFADRSVDIQYLLKR